MILSLSVFVSAQLSFVSSEIIYDESRLTTLDFSGLGFVSVNISEYQFTPRTSGNDDVYVGVYETEEELDGDDFDSIINKQVEVSRNHGNELSVLNAGTPDFYYYRLTGEFAPCDECDVEPIDYGYIYWMSGVNSVVFSINDFSFLDGSDKYRYDEIVSLVNDYREIYPVEGDDIKPTEEGNEEVYNRCTTTNFRFAFVLLGREESDITSEKIEKLNTIKNTFSQAFSEATDNLATADVSHPVQTIIDDGSLMNEDRTEFYRDGVVKKFLETNPDTFNFIVSYNSYELSTGMEFLSTNHIVYGIGRDVYVDEQREGRPMFGIHTQNLFGIAHMGIPIDNIDLTTADYINGILHEIGHQWCCEVGDDFAKGQNDARLEIVQQGRMHFYRGLQSTSETGSPMNSDNWVSNGDGSYKRDNKEGVKKYHPFQLYFMGLLNTKNYDFNKKFQIYDAGIVGNDFDDQTAYPYKELSINDIISVEGERRCVDSELQTEKTIEIKPTEEPVDLPEGRTEEDMVLICAGCVEQNKCFPIGYRTDEEYCSGDETFASQKESDASCNNNFECSTNLCIDNECVSSGFWQKILRFFKNLFG